MCSTENNLKNRYTPFSSYEKDRDKFFYNLLSPFFKGDTMEVGGLTSQGNSSMNSEQRFWVFSYVFLLQVNLSQIFICTSSYIDIF